MKIMSMSLRTWKPFGWKMMEVVLRRKRRIKMDKTIKRMMEVAMQRRMGMMMKRMMEVAVKRNGVAMMIERQQREQKTQISEQGKQGKQRNRGIENNVKRTASS
ncbi:unnamed protein product [Dovyalis caffra]|uniref:Uncharacterized protein n=1 Tax=Dovyalis caffra TaxID=77055 RepID=A0AAV1RIL1_9ROSI|nr:unnamed protein product [Dovyalis caffra]